MSFPPKKKTAEGKQVLTVCTFVSVKSLRSPHMWSLPRQIHAFYEVLLSPEPRNRSEVIRNECNELITGSGDEESFPIGSDDDVVARGPQKTASCEKCFIGKMLCPGEVDP